MRSEQGYLASSLISGLNDGTATLMLLLAILHENFATKDRACIISLCGHYTPIWKLVFGAGLMYNIVLEVYWLRWNRDFLDFKVLKTGVLKHSDITFLFHFNPLKTSPEYTRAGVYGKCVL